MTRKKEKCPVVHVDDLMIPFEYFCEDAWSSAKVYKKINSKVGVRSEKVRKLIKEILTLLPELSKARDKYMESIEKARLRNSLTGSMSVLRSKKILEIGEQSFMARQAEIEKISPTAKRIGA